MNESLTHIFVDSMLINNFVLSVFLGMCSFLGVSGKYATAWRMNLACRLLVDEGKALSFMATRGADEAKGDGSSDGASDESSAASGAAAGIDILEEGDSRADLGRDTRLTTALSPDGLQRRLLTLSRDAQSIMEEQGVNILYLAIGRLTWYEANQADTPRHAPLLLVPVDLRRTSARARFTIRWREEDVEENLSLAAKLRADFGLQLPPVAADEEFVPSTYFDAVTKAIASVPRWKVEPNAITLGLFSFAKLLMYRDLDPKNWPDPSKLVGSQAIGGLLGEGFTHADRPFPDDADIDSLVPPTRLDHVVDADGSQTLAIESVRAGRNLVIQGPPGTGKSELSKVIAHAAGVQLFEVEYADRDGNSLSGRDRYRSLQIAQVFLKGTQHAALLFDEVEDVFPPISVDAAGLMARAEQQALAAAVSHSVNGKAWVNQILESNPVPTIWVTNRIEQIDPAFRRRFAYHLELKSPPPGAREQLIRKALSAAVGDLPVSEAFIGKLTERKGLTPAQIRTAVRFAELATEPNVDTEPPARAAVLENLIDRQLRHADAALGRSDDAKKQGRRQVTTYDLGMLNVETRFEIPRIVDALKARGHGTLCFYGAPGTGKTALGEHIARALDKPLLVKQASDIMSKFVGETEQNMAAMFKEAEEEKAVLLLDEADSFLQDRRGAQRTYEVTEVNEMLQGMERYSGIFICTTNLLDRLDQAALRRFTFKIKFKPLTKEQRETMFVTEALDGDRTRLGEPQRARLAKLEQLCPGDFAAVKRQVDILATAFSEDEFLDQLEAEHRIKPEVRESRGMGFVQ